MKLNFECVRDVLLWLEENISMESVDNRPITTSISWAVIYNNNELLTKHEQADIQYAILNLLDGGMIHADKNSRLPDGTYKILSIDDITWQGHEFLNSIRPESVWKGACQAASKAGIYTLKGIAALCSSVIQNMAQDPNLISSIMNKLIP